MQSSTRIAPLRWLLVAAIILAIIFSASRLNPSRARPPAPVSPPPPPASSPPSLTPRYIDLHLKNPLRTLIAGEAGRFVLRATLRDPAADTDRTVFWDRRARMPLLVWIASPVDSGITFIDPAHPDRPRHHILIQLKPTDQPASPALTATVEYRVLPRTSAGNHFLWMDVYGALATADGERILDPGIVKLAVSVDTHLGTKLLMLAVIAAAVLLFIMEWVRVDVVAIAMMVLLPELGLLNARDTFSGLSSNAVMAIIGVMIISYGLNRAGLVSRITQPLIKYVGTSPRRLAVLFSGLIAVISSVMQNTGAAVLFLPAIRLVAAYRLKIAVGRVLMPIGMAAILGGTLTMIGTSPLILLNDILPAEIARFGFLELTPIGLGLVVGGIAYLSTMGMHMLARSDAGNPENQADAPENRASGIQNAYPLIKGPFEIGVPEDFVAGRRPLAVAEIRRRYLVNIVASARSGNVVEIAPLPESTIGPGEMLCVYGPVAAVRRFVDDYGLDLRETPKHFKDNMFNPSLAGIVEGVVSPRSELIGRTIKSIRFRETFGLNPLAIHQAGKTYYRPLADRPLHAGDAVLIHGTWEQIHALSDLHRNLIIITPFEKEFHKPEKSGWALASFAMALILMMVSSFYFQRLPDNPIPLSVCLMLGAVSMVLTRVITINEAYHAVDWRTVFLLGGLIPLGMAMNQTGTAAWIAKGIVAALGPLMTPLLFLVVMAVLSGAFTMVISNVGACTLLLPLGISIAGQIGIDPRVAAVVVGLGVSNAFILPTHQVNALYMGPGGYRTRDYLKIGGPLAVLYILILVALTDLLYL